MTTTNIRVLLLLVTLVGGGAESSSGQSWQILTKLNYSSQIHLHPHLLIFVTVPWCGESRSLMKELADVLDHDQGRFGSLKVMVLYRCSERMLADAVGADEGITILYYHHSQPYKYHGRLRVQNILSSVHYVMSLLPEQLPFKILRTSEDLEFFIRSTDKALILSEFCGWTQKLLAKSGKENRERDFGFHEQFNVTIAAEENENQGKESEKMDCGVDKRFMDMPWHSEFTSANDSAFDVAENMSLNSGASCEIDEFHRFELFLPKFLTVARDLFLPPERLRFGLVLDRTLLSSLNIKDSGTWLVTLHFVGCPSCLKVLREGDDLKAFAKTQAWPVVELEDDVDDVENALPDNKPSVLLFVDRSSDSLEIREKSRKALDCFREFALKIQMSNQMSEPKAFRSQETSLKAFQISRSTFKHPSVGMLPASQKINIKDKMSIVVMNQGKQVILEDLVTGLQGSSLHEILAYALQQKKEVKLSSLAKDAGFQLLSEDFEIKTAQGLSGQTEVPSNKASEFLEEGVSEGIIDFDRKSMWHEDTILGEQENEQSESSESKTSHVCRKDAEAVLVDTEVQSDQLCPLEGALRRPTDSGKEHFKDQILHVEDVKHVGQSEPVNTELPRQNEGTNFRDDESSEMSVKFDDDDVKEVANSSSAEGTVKELDEQKEKKNFRASFFFLDGHYRRLRALTSGLSIPSVVLIDPTSQQHYVLSVQADFSCALLSEFLDSFLNGSLHPYQQSEHVVPTIREAPIPPFVNLVFHEADSIPRVTMHMFNELVLDNQSDSTNAGNNRDRDVLVLFSNSWCGFCQRMELVVREVHRAIKGYTKTIRSRFKNEQLSLSGDEVRNAILKFPKIYLMDCTSNDCSSILKSAVERELYPSLLLFLAGRKKAIPYGGDMEVSNIINFLADHGSNFYNLLAENGESGINPNMNADIPPFKNSPHEIILQEGTPTLDVQFNQIRAPLGSSAETASHVVVGSILVATDKLLNVHPFDGSKVLVVKVDPSTGFQGLIVNKPISWDSLDELEDGLQLLKEAPLSLGGPVMKTGMPLLVMSRKCIINQSVEVLPNVYVLNQRATVGVIEELRLGNRSIHDFWFFLGYSSWGWDQLFDEIAEGAWIVRSHDEEPIDWPWRLLD